MVTISYMKAGHSLAESAENSEEGKSGVLDSPLCD